LIQRVVSVAQQGQRYLTPCSVLSVSERLSETRDISTRQFGQVTSPTGLPSPFLAIATDLSTTGMPLLSSFTCDPKDPLGQGPLTLITRPDIERGKKQHDN
jgi:hypothetical protein